jgi:monoamine oxidase
MKDTDCLVVGAGAAGLTTAFELKKRGLDVQVLEARDRVGGRTWSGTLDGAEVAESEHWLAIGRSGNEIVLTDVQPDTARALLALAETPADPADVGLARAEAAALEAAGVLVPAAWGLLSPRLARAR